MNEEQTRKQQAKILEDFVFNITKAENINIEDEIFIVNIYLKKLNSENKIVFPEKKCFLKAFISILKIAKGLKIDFADEFVGKLNIK